TTMYSFKNDYSEGAHPHILKKLVETNFEQHLGYGEDIYSTQAKELIKQKIANPDAEIYFVSGGTQSNILVIDALLRAHEAVICVSSGHIYTHEAGAIEAIGHRVITLENPSGKLHPTDVAQLLGQYTLRPHVVKPRMLYISNRSEERRVGKECVSRVCQDPQKKHKYCIVAEQRCLPNELKTVRDAALCGVERRACVLGLVGLFFSSRRRHTRFSRDWSSDVCSSDLCHYLRKPQWEAPSDRCCPAVGTIYLTPPCGKTAYAVHFK